MHRAHNHPMEKKRALNQASSIIEDCNFRHFHLETNNNEIKWRKPENRTFTSRHEAHTLLMIVKQGGVGLRIFPLQNKTEK